MTFEVTRAPTYRLLGRDSKTTSFTTSSTHTTFQDEGLSCSVTYGPSRVLRVSLGTMAFASGGSQLILFNAVRGSTELTRWLTPAADNSLGRSYVWSIVFAGPATGATETFKIQIAAASVNTAVRSDASAAGLYPGPRWMAVEDLGPQ